ncbi:hypothetical protein [Deinococcus hopiensis]|uniref:Uncharacterized protein n=1 Tax=Deinococcus hopiensis KR-140 TaxID=695939 RepID=A0A1W1UX77_9DEIO|nr:hypothetical protein [Deinococcus hopiensis]SMB85755.1 hypothetical protein SAMN00790413_03526 [Deinococcus hopiensis KR-140]
MSLETRLSALATRIGSAIKALGQRVDSTETRLNGLEGAPDLYVQPTQPVVPAGAKYLWVQTGLGADGNSYTLWIEDGS